jgi:hypothetical protein
MLDGKNVYKRIRGKQRILKKNSKRIQKERGLGA